MERANAGLALEQGRNAGASIMTLMRSRRVVRKLPAESVIGAESTERATIEPNGDRIGLSLVIFGKVGTKMRP